MNRIELIILITILFLLAAVSGLAFLSAHSSARDQIRMSDVAKIQTALRTFFSDNGYYPSAVNGVPSGITDYLQSWPTAPAADGSCTPDQNTYHYSPKLSAQDYNLSFCLGRGARGIAAGSHILSSKGIK